jgi:hypothetical protein
MLAVRCQDAAVMNELVRLLFVVPPWSHTVHGETPRWTLHDAAARGDSNVAGMLLKPGADAM